MTTKQRTAGGAARGAPVYQNWARLPGLPLLALALISFGQAGCKSDGCSSCGGFFSRTATNVGNGVQALGAKVFRHGEKGGCSTCGGADEGSYLDSGVPIIAPGGMVVPSPATVIPAPSVESAPSQLEPIPSSSTQPTGSAPSTSRNLPANNRSVYETSTPRGSIARGRTKPGEIARANLPRPEPVPAPADPTVESSDLLDRVPPVDLPTDFTRKATPTQLPTSNDTTPKTGPQTSIDQHPATEASTGNLSAAIAVAPKQAPGIQRSAYVAPSIGGGSAPSLEGLDWLREKGYKTFIDLRQRSNIEPTYVESVNDLGMVYISLPIDAEHLSSSRIARFEELIAQAFNRPLYFCDVNGSRAGLIWYLHLRSVVGEDRESAAQKAEELGLDSPARRLADAYLAQQQLQPQTSAHRDLALRHDVSPPTPTAISPSLPEAAPNSLPTNPTGPPVIPTPEPALELPDSPPAPMNPIETRPQASNISPDVYREPSSWKAVAAFVLTGLGVPLAYWSKTAISGSRIIRRASLPAAERRGLNRPAGSDA